MTSPAELRTDLATLLTGTEEVAGPIPTLAYLPALFSPPQGVVVPGSPYLESGDTFGSFRVRLVAVLIVPATNNEGATSELDAAIDAALVLLLNAKWGVENVSEPYSLEGKGSSFLASDIRVTKTIHL